MKYISIVAVGALLVALPAYAQVGVGAGLDAEVRAGAGTSGVEAGADAGVEGEVRGEAGDEQRAKELDKASPKLMEAQVDGDAGVEVDATTTIRATGGGGGRVSVMAAEVRGWNEEQRAEFLTTVKTHAEVQSGQDLELFARGVLARDENIEAVASSEQEIRVSYRIPAKLFGIFSVSLPATVSVEAAGEGEVGSASDRVKVAFPWTRVFFSVSEGLSEAALKDAVETQLSGDIEVRTSFDASTQARFLETMSAALKARHDAEANAGLNAN